MASKRSPTRSATPSTNVALTDDDLRLLVARVKDYAIFMLDPTGHVASWNEGAERIKGYTSGEIIGRHMSTFYAADEAARGHPHRLLAKAKSDGRVEEEGWRIRKDGTRFWADVIITALRDDSGELRGFAKVTRDLTERREAQLALEALSGRLMRAQDEERRRVGRELHDTTSPLLTSLTGKLYTARQRSRDMSPEFGGLMDEALALAEATATMVRTVSSLLYPALLDQVGLLPALRWYIDNLVNRSGIRVHARLPEGMDRLPREREVVVYLTADEWLRGIIGAGARHADVTLIAAPDVVELTITANGVSPSAATESGGELYVTAAAMRARLSQVLGEMSIEPAKQGMVMTASVPTRP